MAASTGKSRGSGQAGFEKREKRRTIRKLQDAISENNIETVRQLTAEHFDIDFHYRGQTALQLAVREGFYDICKLLIDKGADVNKTDAELNSLLNSACWRGYSDIARLLVEHNADKDSQNDNGSTPLNICAFKGHVLISNLLLTANCDPDIPNAHGQTPLYTATQQENADIVKLLLDFGCDKNKGDRQHRTPLITAAEQGLESTVHLLIKGGCDINCKDRRGRTAIYCAAHEGHISIVEELIASKADLDLATIVGGTPLLESISNNHMEVARLLIDAGCDVNLGDRRHQAPVHAAIRQVSRYFDKQADIEQAVILVKKLVTAQADLNIPDNEGWTPLYQSAFGGDIEITQMMLNNGASLVVTTKTGETILHGGVYGNNQEVVNLLIKAGCQLNATNSAGQHPLMAAVASRSDLKILQSLIDAGSDVNQKETLNGSSPLHEAIHQHYTEAAILLIKSGCDINSTNNAKQSPLYCACEKGNNSLVTYLLKQPKVCLSGAKPSAIPLHAATTHGHTQAVELLIHAGCNINQLNDGGLTPLQAAIQENMYPVAKVLLKYGCDINAHAKVKRLMKCCLFHTDAHPHFGLEPLFLAVTHRNTDLIQLLIQCYVHVPFKTLKILETILKTTQELNVHYSPELKKHIFEIFHLALKKPRSLQEICRGQLREVLGSRPEVKVRALPVANKLQNYISMTEIFLSLEEKEKLESGENLDENGFAHRT